MSLFPSSCFLLDCVLTSTHVMQETCSETCYLYCFNCNGSLPTQALGLEGPLHILPILQLSSRWCTPFGVRESKLTPSPPSSSVTDHFCRMMPTSFFLDQCARILLGRHFVVFWSQDEKEPPQNFITQDLGEHSQMMLWRGSPFGDKSIC